MELTLKTTAEHKTSLIQPSLTELLLLVLVPGCSTVLVLLNVRQALTSVFSKKRQRFSLTDHAV